jgi:hypothetical protein
MELSPAPVAKKIAGRNDSGDSSSSDLSIDINENIDAIKSVTDLEEEEDKKRKAVDDPSSSDSSASTITEDRNNPPETEDGPVGAVENLEPTGVDPKVGVSSNTSGKKKKKKRLDDSSSNSSGTTITEHRNNPPETEGGPVGAVEGLEPSGVDPKVGVSSNTSGKKKKKRLDDSISNSSGTTITEHRNNPSETEGGPVGAVEGFKPTGVDPKLVYHHQIHPKIRRRRRNNRTIRVVIRLVQP